MVDAYLPDIAGAYQLGLSFGTNLRQQREEESRQAQLRGLAPQIIGGDPGAFEQAASLDPEAAARFQSAGDMQTRRLKGAIDYIEQAKKVGNPQAVEAAYQQVRPYLARFGQEPPATFAEAEPKFEEAKARIAMLGAAPAGDNKVVGNALVSPTGQVIYQAPEGTRYFQTDQGLIAVGPEGPHEVTLGDTSMGTREATEGEDNQRIGQMNAFTQRLQAAGMAPEQIRAAQEAFEPVVFGQQPSSGGAELRHLRPAGAPASERRLQMAEESAQRQASAAERAAATSERASNTALAQGELAMRKEVTALVKDSRDVLNSYQKIQATANNPSASNDIALIFSYMKMLDPGSVVREGEFATAQNAGGIPDQVVNAYNRALNGQRLNPEQRKSFVASASQVANTAQNQIDKVADEYRDIAKAYGYDPDRATGLRRNRTQGGAPKLIRYDAQGNRLP